jgi:hypothetical protein
MDHFIRLFFLCCWITCTPDEEFGTEEEPEEIVEEEPEEMDGEAEEDNTSEGKVTKRENQLEKGNE